MWSASPATRRSGGVTFRKLTVAGLFRLNAASAPWKKTGPVSGVTWAS